ncbi:MAG: hypothetical protein WC622_04535 [Pedobacter sp.]|jgi:phenylacetate-CoA ligase|uniref:phenylacetate--CoA ligase family protein n=1 Tax=Pedobacter sp. TaxID=1411316 RepID=UPI00356882AB
MKLKDKLYDLAPNFIQNSMVSAFNFLAYKKRYGGYYKSFLADFKKNRTLSRYQLDDIQAKRYTSFVLQALENSIYYRQLYASIESPENINNISKLPILDKEMLRNNIKDILTIEKTKGIISKTGGTTGKSLEVLFTPKDMQERFAMLDDFRSRFGYALGKKTAWFSGKSLLTSTDITKNRFWKTDYLYHVRYYSTFHIKEEYLANYVKNLIEFAPEFIVGFPSSILEIAKYGLKNNYKFPINVVKAIFPTAETITDEMRLSIEKFFGAPMYDQYASSEGAPFIFECQNGNLHLEQQSGIFEVLDNHNKPSKSGKLVITSFTTTGAPLIRYDIGDSIELSDEICSCENKNPLVKQILGRIDDYLYSPENGKINLGNVSNTLKDTKGIIKFQAIQDDLNTIQIKVVIDKDIYNPHIEQTFIKNWTDRLGQKMKIDIIYVDDIENEKSGKYRIIKNNVKHLIN